MIRTTTLATALLVAVALPARAENLVINGTFRSSVAGWTFADPTIFAHEPDADADGWRGSGSARFRHPHPDPVVSYSFRQCASGLAPGGEYYLEAEAAFRAPDSRSGWIRPWVTFYAGPGCTGEMLSFHVGDGVGTSAGRGTWRRLALGDATSGFVADAGAVSADVAFVVSKDQAGGTLTVFLDNVVLAPVGTRLCRGRVPTIAGGDGPDVLVGTPGPDVIAGFGGDDEIDGGGGADVICAGAGDDTVSGGQGNDLIFGDGGADDLRGNAGNDALLGGPGPDELRGGPGDDDEMGNAGRDVCHTDSPDLADRPQCEQVVGVP